jgi:hypothetical protein
MKPYSTEKTRALITQRVHRKMSTPPTETDIFIADLAAQLEAADERISKQKARIIRIQREEEED